MKPDKYPLITLLVIILFGAFIRLYQLGNIPNGFHDDETDTIYSAYSILKTGLSQYGTFNLLGIQEFAGGSHPPLYTYALLPLVKLGGMSAFIARLPSVISGILSIPLLYFIARKLFNLKVPGLLAAFFLSVNPWAVHISRQGLLEAISLFLVLLGICLLIYSRDQKKIFWLSSLVFGFSLFSYDAPKIFLPLFLPLILFYAHRFLKFSGKSLLIFILIFMSFYSLMAWHLIFDKQIGDFNKVGIFDRQEISGRVDQERYLTAAPLWLSRIFHNKITVTTKIFLNSYFKIFDINWLFISGQGNLQQATSRHGQFHLHNIMFFFLGAVMLCRKNPMLALFLLGWMLTSALPGGLTKENNPYRLVLLLPVPILFSVYGFYSVLIFLKTLPGKIRFPAITAIVIIISVYITSYLFTYFFDYPIYAAEWWGKMANQAVDYGINEQSKYKFIVLPGNSYNYFAYKTVLEPPVFQEAYRNKIMVNDRQAIKIGKFVFLDIQKGTRKNLAEIFPPDSLVITQGDYQTSRKPVKQFPDPGGVRNVYSAYSL